MEMNTENQKKAVYIFIGPPTHGKTLARKIFCELTGIKGASTSDVIYALMARFAGVSESELRETPKEEIRPKLIELGNYLCGSSEDLSKNAFPGKVPDSIYRGPSMLVRTLFHSGFAAFDGIRRKPELEEVRYIMNWLGIEVFVFWIHRENNLAKVEDNTEVEHTDATHIIANNGTPANLREKLAALLKPAETAKS
jgi:hypothetical protein